MNEPYCCFEISFQFRHLYQWLTVKSPEVKSHTSPAVLAEKLYKFKNAIHCIFKVNNLNHFCFAKVNSKFS